jgi:hypothetical protein
MTQIAREVWGIFGLVLMGTRICAAMARRAFFQAAIDSE